MNDFSVPSIKDHILNLAEVRLRNHPNMFKMLKHKLNTGSPRAGMIARSLQQGEWVYATLKSRDFYDIDQKLNREIDSWVRSGPTSKTVVVPLPTPYLPCGESSVTVPAAPPAPKAAAVDQVLEHSDSNKWSIKKDVKLPGYRNELQKALHTLHKNVVPPKAQHILNLWEEKTPPTFTIKHLEFSYETTNGSVKSVSLRSLQRTIDGLIDKT